jgi:hypothetical protein
MDANRRFGHRDRPSVKQIYALCAALCERQGEGFPETRIEASELIERLRIESGHPNPSLREREVRPKLRPDRLK